MKNRRHYEIDLARALPLLFLPAVHCFEEFSYWGMLTPRASEAGSFWLYLCILGPSIFMMVLGMNIAFSAHTSPKELARRGLITIGIFLAHNLIRFVIPGLIDCCFVNEADRAELFSIIIPDIVKSDILMFAGLSFLVFALFKKLRLSPVTILGIGLLTLSIDMLLPVEMPYSFLSCFLGDFIYVNDSSCFSLLPWLPYPAIGYILGTRIKGLAEEEKAGFYNRLMLIGAAMVVTLSAGLLSNGLDPLQVAAAAANSNITELFNIILDTGIGFVWLGLIYHLWGCLRSEKLRAVTVRISRSIMIFYLAQWVFVGWTEFIVGGIFYRTYRFGLFLPMAISVVIFILSLIVAFRVQDKLDARKAAKSPAAAG